MVTDMKALSEGIDIFMKYSLSLHLRLIGRYGMASGLFEQFGLFGHIFAGGIVSGAFIHECAYSVVDVELVVVG